MSTNKYDKDGNELPSADYSETPMTKVTVDNGISEREFAARMFGMMLSIADGIVDGKDEASLSVFIGSNLALFKTSLIEEAVKEIEGKKKECPHHNPEERVECYGYDENYNNALDESITILKSLI